MENNRFWDNVCLKFYDRQILQKITHQSRNQHITMCPYIKLTLNFVTKFA